MKYIIGNWKMNKKLNDATNFLENLNSVIDKKINCEILIAPPIVYLPSLFKSYSDIGLVAQNLASQEYGAYTGEVSANMLQGYVNYSLIGHSERRHYFNEENTTLYAKILICLKYNIKPILCIGESKGERDLGTHFSVIEQQLKETVLLLNDRDLLKVIIAYEPVWAIGTGETASSNQIRELHNHIRKIFINRLGESNANNIPILYGGSCNSINTSSILTQKNVDGLLVGGASLDIDHFKNMIETAYGLFS
tara:strand:+ start:3705 stop:4457 length:753 start_codon:yes stop_codon:yes gene_type:complete